MNCAGASSAAIINKYQGAPRLRGAPKTPPQPFPGTGSFATSPHLTKTAPLPYLTTNAINMIFPARYLRDSGSI